MFILAKTRPPVRYGLILGTLAGLALMALPAHAETPADRFEVSSTADLVRLCAVSGEDPMADAALGFCYGFLSGASNYHRAIYPPSSSQQLFCLPKEGVTRADAARMFVDWSNAHPQHSAEAPVDTLIRFAVATWPCAQARQ